jgi:hypothetical protein
MAGQGALGVLDREHAGIDELFEKVSSPEENRGQVLNELVQRIATHIAVERGVFYPVVTEKELGGPEAVQTLERDYKEMERLLVLIERRKINSPDMPDLVTDLKTAFEEHRRQFTENISPASEELLSPDERAELEEKMNSAADVIVTHPHPHMLSLGPVSRLTTRLAVVFDRLRDRTVDLRMMPHRSKRGSKGPN